MAPDAEILPRSRSRHLLRQETGAPALRKTTRCRMETKPGRVHARRVVVIYRNATTYIYSLIATAVRRITRCFYRTITRLNANVYSIIRSAKLGLCLTVFPKCSPYRTYYGIRSSWWRGNG